MKKRLITAGIVAAVLAIAAVLFWPHTKTYSFSGVATEWSRSHDEQYDETADLSVEITEVRSLVCSYKKSFSYVLNGKRSPDCYRFLFNDTGIGSLITGIFLIDEGHSVSHCDVSYDWDLSRVTVYDGDRQYELRF